MLFEGHHINKKPIIQDLKNRKNNERTLDFNYEKILQKQLQNIMASAALKT